MPTTTKVTRLDDDRRAAAYWRTTMTMDSNLRALRDGLMTFAKGCTQDEASKVLAQIIADYGMRPDQLPDVVDILAAPSGFGPHATVLWLYQTAHMAKTQPGRMLLREIVRNIVAAEAAAAAAETPH